VNTVRNFRVSIYDGKFVRIRSTGGFSKWTQLHGLSQIRGPTASGVLPDSDSLLCTRCLKKSNTEHSPSFQVIMEALVRLMSEFSEHGKSRPNCSCRVSGSGWPSNFYEYMPTIT
jgi:hypothetical protein